MLLSEVGFLGTCQGATFLVGGGSAAPPLDSLFIPRPPVPGTMEVFTTLPDFDVAKERKIMIII